MPVMRQSGYGRSRVMEVMSALTPPPTTITTPPTTTTTNPDISSVSDGNGLFELGTGSSQVTNLRPGHTASCSVLVTFSNAPTGPDRKVESIRLHLWGHQCGSGVIE